MSLTENIIDAMDLDKIDLLLNGTKYIPALTKERLVKRKEILETKSEKTFKNNIDSFPIIANKPIEPTTTTTTNAWAKKSTKIYDTKNVPVRKNKNILKNNNKVVIPKVEITNTNDEEDDDAYYNDDY